VRSPKDAYGRELPKHSHGSENLKDYSSSTRELRAAACSLFDRITDKKSSDSKIEHFGYPYHTGGGKSEPRKAL
jgi:hypothetical protein